MKTIHCLLLGAVLLGAAGCNSFERATARTLEAAQATLVAAQANYDSWAIPQTLCARVAIREGKAALSAAGDAMTTYEGHGKTADQRAAVVTALDALAPRVDRVQSLIDYPDSCGMR